MKIKRPIPREETVNIECDICHKSCAKDEGRDNSSEYAALSAHWGYWSDGKDLSKHECHMCEGCFEKVKNFIEKELKGTVRHIEAHFPGGFGGPVTAERVNVDYKVLPPKSAVEIVESFYPGIKTTSHEPSTADTEIVKGKRDDIGCCTFTVSKCLQRIIATEEENGGI